MAYTYILQLDNGKYYVGSCHDIEGRLQEHVKGRTFSTHGKQPELVYYEKYNTTAEAIRREMQLKGGVYPELVEGE